MADHYAIKSIVLVDFIDVRDNCKRDSFSGPRTIGDNPKQLNSLLIRQEAWEEAWCEQDCSFRWKILRILAVESMPKLFSSRKAAQNLAVASAQLRDLSQGAARHPNIRPVEGNSKRACRNGESAQKGFRRWP